MKKAPAPTKTQGAFQNHTLQSDSTNPTTTVGAFPERLNTVSAEVLARLISGESMTGMDAVFCASTTRLAAIIDYLETAYNWTIDRRDIDVGTKDGRIVVIRAYYLTRAVIRRAFDAGAIEFCRGVKSARAKLRDGASKTIALAKRRNAVRIASRVDPRQSHLFGGMTND